MNAMELIPIIIGSIKAVEAALPEKGKGPEKLQAVKAILAEAVGDIEAVWPSLQAMVGLLVTIYNARGIFKRG